MAKFLRTTLAAALGLCTVVSAASAGGFSRGEADTDILYEDGLVVMRTGATYVNPNRQFDTVTIRGVAVQSDDDAYSDPYWIPTIAAKGRFSQNFACAFTYTQPFAASTTYGTDAQTADFLAGQPASRNYYSHKEFDTDEYGATCDVKFAAGPGNLHILGGVFLQDFSYRADALYGVLRLEEDTAPGYRLGAAYDIPEYAMRAQLMYRSAIDHEVDGTFTPLALAPLLGTAPVAADGYGTLPQSLKFSLQSGIAPGWLAYGSVKWTDWSVLQALNYNIAGLPPQQDVYNWKDGWTIQGGIGHAFTEKVAGTFNVTWDKGVGTGADIMTDTWTFAAGTAIDVGPGELRLGAGLTYMTAGSQNFSEGATYSATAGGDWAYAFSGTYRFSF